MANTTWNPADLSNVTLSGANLVALVGTGVGGVRSVHNLSSGKYYWEKTLTTINTNSLTCGISLATASISAPTTGSARVIRLDGSIYINNIATGSSISGSSPLGVGSVIGFAVDFTAQLIWCRLGAAGQWNGSGTANPATSTGGLSISSIAGALFAMMGGQTSDRVTANFGDSAFTGTTPSGFTPGFPAPPTSARATQVALEEWASPDPAAQLTQVGAEVWAAVTAGVSSALVTQVAVEQWAPVTSAVVPAQYAVTVIT